MLWSRQQQVFSMEAFFSNGRSVIAVQHGFRRHIDIPPRGHVPDWKCVLIPVCDNGPTQSFLPALQEKDLDNVWLHHDGRHTRPGLPRAF
ncbi:hypothetical protein TNCV_4277421 [Trichonephila clavipes]|nr:hypothetical protein TNCV_4277421 [Trichonephila clavipes]